MRALHFRVWNGFAMEYNVTVGKFGTFYVNPGVKGDGLNEKDSACLTDFTTRYSDVTDVMQYTGLSDKKGIKIYEGDIVVKYHLNPKHEETNHHYPVVVKWNDDYARFNVQIKNEGRQMPIIEYEVVGNIYQNPELIRQ